jgi:predicted  nucleic acid-binding Zn-ribbon protein
VTPEEINDYSKIQRVCRHCGKVWFSYVGDESVLEPSFRRTFALGMVRSFMSEQGRIENIVDERLKRDAAQKLRQCPNCGKKDYDELILL